MIRIDNSDNKAHFCTPASIPESVSGVDESVKTWYLRLGRASTRDAIKRHVKHGLVSHVKSETPGFDC